MNLLPLIALAAYAVVAFKRPRTGFLLFVAFLPAYLIRFSLIGIPTTALEVMFGILVVAWLRGREKRLVDIRGWRALMLLWLAVSTVALLVSPEARAVGVWKAYFVEPIVFFIMAVDLLRTPEDRRAALRSLGFTAMAIGVAAIAQKFTGWGVPPPFNGVPVPPATEAETRSTAFYGFPNAIGLFLAPLIPLFLGRLRETWQERRAAAFWAAALALSAAALVLAESEGAIIGAAAGTFIMLTLVKRTRRIALAAAALGAVVILAVAPLRQLAVEKGTLSDWSGRVRKEMWAETWTMLRDRPILGAGLSGYPKAFAPYHKAGHIEIFQYPHTLVLNFWSELGLAGLVAFALLMIRFFRSAALTEAWALVGAGAAILVHGLVDVPYFKNDLSMLFWLLLAFAAARAAETRTPKPADGR